MKPQLVEDNDTHYVMHDGKSKFRVPKAGLSDEMHGKIRAMAPKKMAEGGLLAAGPGPFDAPDTRPVSAPGSGPFESPTDYAVRIAPPAKPAPIEAAPAVEPSPVEKKDWFAKPDAKLGSEPTPTGPGMLARPDAQPTPQSWEAQQAAKIGFADDEAPKPAPKKGGGGGVTPSQPFSGLADKEKEAAASGLEADLAKNDRIAAVQADLASKIQANAIDQNEARARAAQNAKDGMQEIYKTRDALKNLDMTVDPGRFWASRSTPGKIAGVLGLMLGALGTGPDGVNRAAGIIQQSIDRDLDAQKTEHTLRMQQGKEALDSATHVYSLYRQQGLDDISALAAAKGTYLDLAKSQVDTALAQNASPAAKAAYEQLKVKIDKEAQAAYQTVEQRKFDNGIKQQDANTRAREAGLREGKAGAKPYLGGNAAFNALKAEWQGAGGKAGLITGHIPGTKANDYNDTIDARAIAIATQLNGGKPPKPAFIEYVKKTIPRTGDSIDDGNNKLRALSDLLASGVVPAEYREESDG